MGSHAVAAARARLKGCVHTELYKNVNGGISAQKNLGSKQVDFI
jgi:hypothetical protein